LAFYLWQRVANPRVPIGRGWEIAVFCGLLLLQYPMIFLLERGGTDVPPLFLWTLAALAFTADELVLCGVLAGIAGAYKLYPMIPASIIGFALVRRDYRNWRVWQTGYARFGVGLCATFGIINWFYRDEARVYFKLRLPKFAAEFSAAATFGHSLVSYAGADHDLYPKFVLLLFFALWCFSAARAIALRPLLTFAATLAMSSYFAGTSYDYNLITTYPLLLLLFIEAQRTDRWSTLVFGLFAIVGERELFNSSVLNLFNPPIHLSLQFAWLVVVAVDLARQAPAVSATPEAEALPQAV
jgi:hypothetical protein